MANPFLSGRVPLELLKQVEQYLAQSGESKTELIIKAVSAYIGIKLPDPKGDGDKRLENLEQEVAELKGAIKSLYEKFAAFNPKLEEPTRVEDLEVKNEQTNSSENTANNINNKSEIDSNNNPQNNVDDKENKTFTNIDTAEVVRLTKLNKTQITNFRSNLQTKLKKHNRTLPLKQILDTPEKISTEVKIYIGKILYDIFYVGQSEDGKNLWNLVCKKSGNKQLNLLETHDNS